jgi:hypothetical protein
MNKGFSKKDGSDGKFRLKPQHIFLLAALVVLLVLSARSTKLYKGYAQDRLTKQELDMDYIYFNVFASDIQLGGLTKEQAKKKLEKELNEDQIIGKEVYLQSMNFEYEKTLTFEELGASYNIDELVEQAYNYGRTGSEKERLATIQKLQNTGKFLDPVISYDDEKVKAAVSAIESDVNSSLLSGNKLDVDRTVEMIEEQLKYDISGSTIYLPEK